MVNIAAGATNSYLEMEKAATILNLFSMVQCPFMQEECNPDFVFPYYIVFLFYFVFFGLSSLVAKKFTRG
jgi:hypothetical protein